MACYLDEEQVWKCPKHPSKRRKSGICPTCLRERLVTLCPDCANLRPCSCCAAAAAIATTTSPSSSSSSSFSLFSSRGSRREPANTASASASGVVGEVGRVSSLIESEPAFRRSRSLAIPFLRSRSRFVGVAEFSNNNLLPPVSRSKISFWSMFKLKKVHKGSDDDEKSDGQCKKIDEFVTADDYSMMRRSRSVAIGVGAGLPPPGKGRGWYFASPMKAFRSSKTSKVVQERSPLQRG